MIMIMGEVLHLLMTSPLQKSHQSGTIDGQEVSLQCHQVVQMDDVMIMRQKELENQLVHLLGLVADQKFHLGVVLVSAVIHAVRVQRTTNSTD